MQDEKYDKAVRAAEQARRLWKGQENLGAEANALNIIAQAHVQMQHKKESLDVRGGAGAGGKDAWDKALRAGTEALKISRELSDDEQGKLFTGTALCTLAEVYLAKKSGDDALTQANEAVGLFIEGGDEPRAGHAWVLCAQADILKEDYNQARDDASEGLEIFKIANDEAGQKYAQSVLDLVDKIAPAPAATGFSPEMMQAMMAQMGGGGAPAWKVPGSAQMKQPVAAAAAPEPAAGQTAVVRKGGAAGVLDVSAGINVDIVSAKIKEVAMGIIGDEEDIEVDTPLMQAGLTSNTAVLLRDEMSTTIPGVNLPPTLMFDYPSISAIAEFIVEKAGSK